MDQRLKERLIGAVVLVVLAVWLIPWLLDGPAREPGPETVALSLPAADEAAPTKSVTIDLDDRGRPEVPADKAATAADAAAGSGNAEPAAEPVPGRAGTSERGAPTDPGSSAGNASATGGRPPASAAEAESPTGGAAAADASTGAAAGDNGSSPPVARDGEPAAGGSPADAAGNAAAASAPQPAADGDWAVQLGSFGEVGNAERLAARVETFGYEPAVSEYRSGGRDLHRVRVGPQPSRARAEAVASALTAHGFVAQVVTSD